MDLNNEQKIIFVAGNFRKEVTSTVLWLRDKYKLKIQCFEVSLSKLENQYLLDIEQIIPAKKEVDEFMISISNKNLEEITVKARAAKNIEFWSAFISESNKKNKLFEMVSPSKDSWIGCALGLSGISISVVISKTYARCEVYFNRGRNENKQAFDFVFGHKNKIEKELGEELTWERMDEKNTCRIKFQMEEVNIDNKEDWPQMISYLIDSSEKMVKVFKPIIDNELRAFLAKK